MEKIYSLACKQNLFTASRHSSAAFESPFFRPRVSAAPKAYPPAPFAYPPHPKEYSAHPKGYPRAAAAYPFSQKDDRPPRKGTPPAKTSTPPDQKSTPPRPERTLPPPEGTLLPRASTLLRQTGTLFPKKETETVKKRLISAKNGPPGLETDLRWLNLTTLRPVKGLGLNPFPPQSNGLRTPGPGLAIHGLNIEHSTSNIEL